MEVQVRDAAGEELGRFAGVIAFPRELHVQIPRSLGMTSGEPAVEILGDELVVVELRMRPVNARDLVRLAW